MATTPNVINDLSTLTKVPNKILDALTEKLNLCIGSAIHDAIIAEEPAVIINIGIGSLCVSLSDMQCKFVPGKDLKQTIKRCMTEEIDPLEFELEKALAEKLVNICSEVI